MYLHIGKDIILKKEEIIGIFNIESIAETKEYKIIIDKLKEERKIQDISKEDQKTLILYKKNVMETQNRHEHKVVRGKFRPQF